LIERFTPSAPPPSRTAQSFRAAAPAISPCTFIRFVCDYLYYYYSALDIFVNVFFGAPGFLTFPVELHKLEAKFAVEK
jgi:hypothetical protein